MAMLLGLSSHSFSQDYHPFINNSVWVIYLPDANGSDYHTIGPETDVMVDGVVYKRYIDTSFNNQEVLIREDVENKKVYRRVGDADVLLYDFGVSVGDPVTLGSGMSYNVSSITYIQMANGTTRKKISLNSFIASETWIEGVGNFRNPLRTGSQFATNPSSELLCSYQENTNIFNIGQYLGGNPTDCMSLGTGEINNSIIAKFTPNPFQLTATLRIDGDISGLSLRLFDQSGRLVRENAAITTNQIVLDRTGLASGVYFAQLLKNGKAVSTQKLVIKD